MPEGNTHPRVGVIDIGSNSVRLVIYDALKRVPIPIFNEKALCGLARGLEETGWLNRNGVAMAHRSLTRFSHIASALGVIELYVLATAAVRDASDGKAFVADVERLHGLKVQIISGNDEAKFAALGVASSIYRADGVIVDLGGGSLEIAEVVNGEIGECRSFPIGLLRLLPHNHDRKKLTEIIDSHLKASPVIKALEGRNFYTVGGSFRSLAKIHIAKSHYPINIVHHYTVSASSIQRMAHAVSQMQPDELEAMPGITLKRVEMLPCTALVVERIIALGKPRCVTFSAHGIREGFLFASLSRQGQEQDPLIAACEYLMQGFTDAVPYSEELMAWLDPLFEGIYACNLFGRLEVIMRSGCDTGELEQPAESAGLKRLRKAASILSEIACLEHNEYRSEIAFRRVIDAYFIGINHPSRIFLAKTLFHRYQTEPDTALLERITKLLRPNVAHYALVLGLALRLARNITAGATKVLQHTRLEVNSQNLLLHFNEQTAGLAGDVVSKRLNKLASALNLTPVISLPEDQDRPKWVDNERDEEEEIG